MVRHHRAAKLLRKCDLLKRDAGILGELFRVFAEGLGTTAAAEVVAGVLVIGEQALSSRVGDFGFVVRHHGAGDFRRQRLLLLRPGECHPQRHCDQETGDNKQRPLHYVVLL